MTRVAGMPRLSRPPFVCHARRDHRHLDRVQHAVAVFEVAEPVPVLARVQHPAVGSVRQHAPAGRPRTGPSCALLGSFTVSAFQV